MLCLEVVPTLKVDYIVITTPLNPEVKVEANEGCGLGGERGANRHFYADTFQTNPRSVAYLA